MSEWWEKDGHVDLERALNLARAICDRWPSIPDGKGRVPGMSGMLAFALLHATRDNRADSQSPYTTQVRTIDPLEALRADSQEEQCPRGGTHARIAHPNGRCIKCGGSAADSQEDTT